MSEDGDMTVNEQTQQGVGNHCGDKYHKPEKGKPAQEKARFDNLPLRKERKVCHIVICIHAAVLSLITFISAGSFLFFILPTL